jgi:hypothetical protein
VRPPLLARLAALFIPEERREAFLGDLLEELSGFVLPERGAAGARWWLLRQLAAAVAPALGYRLRQSGRWIVARSIMVGVFALLAALQAWDSGVFGAAPGVIALVALAVALPALAVLLAASAGVRLGAVIASAALLLAAKLVAELVSARPLPALVVIAAMAFALFLADERRVSLRGGGDRPAAP